MELMQLIMFVAVVEEGSVHMAAERVFRTQPAVSIAVRKLEREIGASLLDRAHRYNYQLTPAGELLYSYATRLLALRNEADRRYARPQLNCAAGPCAWAPTKAQVSIYFRG